MATWEDVRPTTIAPPEAAERSDGHLAGLIAEAPKPRAAARLRANA